MRGSSWCNSSKMSCSAWHKVGLGGIAEHANVTVLPCTCSVTATGLFTAIVLPIICGSNPSVSSACLTCMHVVTVCAPHAAGMVSGNRSEQQQVLARYAEAVRARDVHTLSAYTSTAALDAGVRRVLATRVIAGVWDANTYMLHDLATRLVAAAQSSRCATRWQEHHQLQPAVAPCFASFPSACSCCSPAADIAVCCCCVSVFKRRQPTS